jgi:hypothetical protein
VPRYDVTVRVSPEALPLVRKSPPYRKACEDARAESDAAKAELAEDVAGWIVTSLRFEVVDEAIPYVLRFGGEMEVAAPLSLRRTVAALAGAAAARYADRRATLPAQPEQEVAAMTPSRM